MSLRPERVNRGRGSALTWIAIGTVAVLALLVLRRGVIDLPIPGFGDGGRSDPAPRGGLFYESQQARSASEAFLVDIGNGEAVVSVKAKQDHDKPGNIFSGDFQSTNGTSSVADPDDRDVPARLVVKVDYCAEGMVTRTDEPGTDGEVATSIRLELGDLFVCDTTLEHTPENDAAFRQDDTPTEFHGKFVSFVAGAAETVAAAAACPTDELERFGRRDLVSYMERQLARRFGVAAGQVEVVAGTPGATDRATKEELRERLERYANVQDPDDPDHEFEALTIQYLSGTGEAVADSCYKDPGGRDLDTLENLDVPEAR